MKLIIDKILNYELIHYASDDLFIASKGNKVTYNNKVIEIPEDISFIEKIFKHFRKGRRLLRLDKITVYPSGNNVIIVRRGKVFHYDTITGKIDEVLTIACRNPMFLGITDTEAGNIFMGEYGNPSNEGKRIFKSTDGGLTWECVYNFSMKEMRHIHCVSWDPYQKKIWVFTGDANGECKIMFTDESFMSIEYIGDGGQKYRTCHALFSENYVDWIMDSPLETVKHIRYNRKTGKISEGYSFSGPVWFAKRLQNGISVAASNQEKGPSHKDKYLHLYATDDMNKWEELKIFNHDGWPKGYFRFGTICFSRGMMKDNSFYMFFEGVKGLDGKSALCRIVD